MSVQEFLKEFLKDDVLEFRSSLTPETDRGVALVSAAYLEHELEGLLRRYFVDDTKIVSRLFEPTGPLGTFSAKIDLICALGILPSGECRSLHLVRKIRNEFAHQHKVLSFRESEIRSRCLELIPLNPDPGEGNPRDLFIRACMSILATIHAAGTRIKHAAKTSSRMESSMKELRANYENIRKTVATVVESLDRREKDAFSDPRLKIGMQRKVLKEIMNRAVVKKKQSMKRAMKR
jgi:DNA-binding MltR family transcriptional regulator